MSQFSNVDCGGYVRENIEFAELTMDIDLHRATGRAIFGKAEMFMPFSTTLTHPA